MSTVKCRHSLADIKKIIKKVKRSILVNSYKTHACHIGSALSCARILVELYFKIMKPHDLFIFAKASGVSALYAVLAEKRVISKNKIAYYLKHYPLASKEVPGVLHSVGSVGMGLSVAVGLALADWKRDVYCLVSDGQLQEGVTYEAALFAHQHNLKNLHVICDDNEFQACGRTEDILDLSNSFGFFAFTFPDFKRVRTTKGDGVDFIENKTEWHYRNLNKQELKNALCQI